MEVVIFLTTEKEEQWYTNKELFQLLEDLKKETNNLISSFKSELEPLKIEMAQTRILIKDYNGLRNKIDACEKTISEIKTTIFAEKSTKKAERDYIAWGIAVIMFMFSVADRFVK